MLGGSGEMEELFCPLLTTLRISSAGWIQFGGQILPTITTFVRIFVKWMINNVLLFPVEVREEADNDLGQFVLS